jgi:LPXTG-motif cell wall-anchored protein
MNKMSLRVGCVALGLLSVIPYAKADEWNQKTIFTFSGPVEVPGRVLEAGTYVFKLMDSPSDRNIVQVFSKDERHLYGTFLAIPDLRLQPADKPIITFSERPAGTPEAIRAWFYPGDNYGHEFVYPKPKAVQLAKANNTPVASMPAEMMPVAAESEPQVAAMKQAPIKAETPDEREVEVAEVFVLDSPAPALQAPATLPKTGSEVPLVGLLGLISVGAALALSVRSR